MVKALSPSTLTLSRHGAEWRPGAATAHLPALTAALGEIATQQAGVQVHSIKPLRPILASQGPIGAIATAALGRPGRAVRAVLFDKTADTNWSLAWHQDRTMCVKHRIDVEGFGPWTTKAGLQHVAPPFDLLACMVTLRVHLDDVAADNAPLLIAPGSHTRGRVPVGEIDAAVRECGTVTCLAATGDVWVYATPILHASEAASSPKHRRVLQVDYSADGLPGGLEWLGV